MLKIGMSCADLVNNAWELFGNRPLTVWGRPKDNLGMTYSY